MLQNNPAYQGILGPKLINERHINEDVPMGLVPMEALARIYEIASPTISALISMANSLLQVDFRITGRNLARLGLGGLKPSDISDVLKEGFRKLG